MRIKKFLCFLFGHTWRYKIEITKSKYFPKRRKKHVKTSAICDKSKDITVMQYFDNMPCSKITHSYS